MPRHGYYIHRRKGTKNLWARFHYTGSLAEAMGRRMKEVPLGTSDVREAEVRVLPLIAEHKRLLLTHKARQEGVELWEEKPSCFLNPGESITYPSGQTIVGTTDSYIAVAKDGGGVRTLPRRPMLERRIRTETPLGAQYAKLVPKAAQVPKHEALDAEIIAAWVTKQRIDKYEEAKVRDAYRVFREITGKTFATATYDDGANLANNLLQSLAYQTVEKRVGFLRAACRLAIKARKLQHNPFSEVMPERQKGDAVQRLPFNEEHMALMRSNLHRLSAEDRLLWTIVAATGMRRSEAFEIVEEHKEGSIRYVIIGTKTDASERRVPLPSAVLPLLPARIKGRLFTVEGDADEAVAASAKAASKRLGRWIRRLGISAPDARGRERLVALHSLRHRAKDVLRAQLCPTDIQEAILGHQEKTVAAGYGVGYPVAVLKRWIERIGY